MAKFKDLTGLKFGKLTAIKIESLKPTKWLCKCECGNYTVVSANHLTSNETKSCGCSKKRPPANTTHHLSKHKLYYIWNSIKQRCNNINDKRYKNYGLKGIKLCDEWKDFKNFYNWAIKNGYDENIKNRYCSIDRINVNGDYEPSNCRWVSQKVQQNNRTNNHFVEYNGQRKTIAQWSDELGIEYYNICRKINKGATIKDIVDNML